MQFYVETVLGNEVYGIPLPSGPEVWQRALGDEFVDDTGKQWMRRDYGLVEISFEKQGGMWEFRGVTLQAHRLGWEPDALDGLVPTPLRRTYGDFPQRVRFADLRDALLARGAVLEDTTDPFMGEFRRYRETTSGCGLHTIDDHEALGPDALWSISPIPSGTRTQA